MSKPKSLVAQIEEIEAAKKKLSNYEKLFDKACKLNFDYDSKQIKKIIKNQDNLCDDFGNKISQYFGLKNNQDFADFLFIFCTETNLNYYQKKRTEGNVSAEAE